MKFSLLLLLLIGCMTNLQAQNCKGMHEGVFLYLPEEGSPINGDYYVERKDSIQFEYWGEDGEYIQTKVIWDDACYYHTSHIGTNSEAVKKKLRQGKGLRLTWLTFPTMFTGSLYNCPMANL
ncbi:hypothetical protein BH09BAC1_BH09BAC1_14900 [soil metagenome]